MVVGGQGGVCGGGDGGDLVVVEMGYLVEKEEEEEAGGGGGWRSGWPRQAHGCHFVACKLAVKERRKKKVKERGRRKGGYIRGENIIILPFPS